MSITRRDFLRTSLASMTCFSTAATIPGWITKSAHALGGLPNDRILVIVQMSGGNDGINTVIPYTDPVYNGNAIRPNLHIIDGLDLTTLDGLNAFHPKMIRLKDWFADGRIAVVQNVGYPNPDLSHFIATDYWEFGTSPGATQTPGKGWIARYIDNACAGMPPESINPLSMLGAGNFFVPTTLNGSDLYTPPAVGDFGFYQYFVPGLGNPADPFYPFGQRILDYLQALNGVPPINSAVDFVQRSSNLAFDSVEDMQVASQEPVLNPYPAGQLGSGLDMASKVIRAGFPTSVFYVSQGGYDTHANQFAQDDPTNFGDHPRLLEEFDQALHAFLADMYISGNLDRVCILTFSEFGRRVDENGSSGTDHGTSNCLFVMGGAVKGGVYGGQPDLVDLQNGNLRHNIDFRSVYARVLQDWFGVDPEPIFGTEDFNDEILDIQGGMAQIPIFEGLGAVYGDVNNDGVVNAADVQKVINVAIGADDDQSADVNLDGIVNAVDLQAVINAALGR